MSIIHVGSRLRVSSYHDPVLSPADLHILIHPSGAFGDGSHITTQMCLELLEQEIRGGERVFDLGTGTGILAIAAAKLGARQVIAADVDRASCEAAVANVRSNRVAQTVRLFHGSVHAVRPSLEFDLAVANLYNAQQVIDVVPELARRIRARGQMICAGIWVRRGLEMSRLLAEARFTVERQLTRHQLLTILARKTGSSTGM